MFFDGCMCIEIDWRGVGGTLDARCGMEEEWRGGGGEARGEEISHRYGNSHDGLVVCRMHKKNKNKKLEN